MAQNLFGWYRFNSNKTYLFSHLLIWDMSYIWLLL